MPYSLGESTILRPFLVAGLIIIIFGGLCIWIAQIIGLKEEGDGFRIIGWRFIIAGIVLISLGYLFRNFRYIYKHLVYLWKTFGIRRRRSKYDELYRP
jgi:hypothetical protein